MDRQLRQKEAAKLNAVSNSHDRQEIRALRLLSRGVARFRNRPRRTRSLSPPLKQVNWVPNELASNCYECKVGFSLTLRKHHCRECGNIFCDKCSPYKVPLPARGLKKPVRVCVKCHRFLVVAPMYDAALLDDETGGGVDGEQGQGHASPSSRNRALLQQHQHVADKIKRKEVAEVFRLELAQHELEAVPGEEMKAHLPHVVCSLAEPKDVIEPHRNSNSNSNRDRDRERDRDRDREGEAAVCEQHEDLQHQLGVAGGLGVSSAAGGAVLSAAARDRSDSLASVEAAGAGAEAGPAGTALMRSGTLVLTNFRVIFFPKLAHGTPYFPLEVLTVRLKI